MKKTGLRIVALTVMAIMVAAVFAGMPMSAKAAVVMELRMSAGSDSGAVVKFNGSTVTASGIPVSVPSETSGFYVSVEPSEGYEFSGFASMKYDIYDAAGVYKAGTTVSATTGRTSTSENFYIGPVQISSLNVSQNFVPGGSVVLTFTGVRAASSGGSGTGGGGNTGGNAADRVFPDVAPGSYYEDAVRWAKNNGVTSGTGTGLFGTGQTLSRAEAATFLYAYAKATPQVGGKSFSDVQEGRWYTTAVKWMAARGFTSGYDDGRFGVGDPVTRGEALTFLCAMHGGSAGYESFSDVDRSMWQYKGVSWANEKGLLNNVPNGQGSSYFYPLRPCTREDFVTFIHRCSGFEIVSGTSPSPDPVVSEKEVHAKDVPGAKSNTSFHNTEYIDNMGQTYTDGFYLISGGRLLNNNTGFAEFYIEGEYKRFTGRVAVRQSNADIPVGGNIEVYGDGKLLFDSGAMGRGVRPVDFDVDVTGVKTVRVVINGGDWHSQSLAYGSCELLRPYFYK